jgi:putative nucleotidyltransferase with HDIG domain
MGAFKPLLPLGDKTLLEHVIGTVERFGPAALHVVVGYRAESLMPLLENTGAAVVRNRMFKRGMYSSVCAGLRSLAADIDAFFLLPADIPLVRTATFRRLAVARRGRPHRIVYPVFQERRGHPPLIPVRLIPAILERSGRRGLRSVLAQWEDLALNVDVADEHILFDVDRPEDYAAAKLRLARLEEPSPAECEVMLNSIWAVAPDILRHSRQVQQAAVAICRTLNRAGARIDEDRVAAAALLHDIAKGAPDHARTGGRMLREMGFERIGDIVASHIDLPEAELRNPKEAAVVYLADKLVSKERFVALESRFDAALARFDKDARARSAVERRRAAAMAVQRYVEDKAGTSLERVLSAAGIQLDAEQT